MLVVDHCFDICVAEQFLYSRLNMLYPELFHRVKAPVAKFPKNQEQPGVISSVKHQD